MADLTGKVALVTGASRGIGAATAERLARDGADVVLTYASSPDDASEVARRIEATGRRATAVRADAGDPAAVAEAVERTVTEYGRLDILVNNAGILMGGPLKDISEAEVDRILAVNLRAAFLGARAAEPHLGEGGRIINIGSVGAHWFPQPGGALYGMTKSALIGMTKGLARDFGPKGTTVNLISPGPIRTAMLDEDGPMDVPLLPLTALGRFGEPAEVASLIAFLASDEAAFITGATITIDGGISL
ncbi:MULTISPECIES: SDR family NAD(P)-dependent oxidoreductase [unclassified Kitasatospora]|uniref:SDR family NAD(P)-dependent oxidoreductase n=1 Tax=unclassified Kitasatospora TaxID=2633591 RepID=UPI000710F625|nr:MULTISPECIES: 3-oxoacyl-ACP reductase family protein [unclassified Kitasatospora]KQV18702.1 oxidoreductase [Kitasatospora sp. Root107]KRB74684.1 oxidoreductase [Kitasatospora sp. Root187]